jgi:hypothetical protein
MDLAPSPSPIEIAAATLRGIWAALWSGFGLDLESVISDWVSGIFRRLEELRVQYQAGQTAAVDDAGCGGAGAGNSRVKGSLQAPRMRAASMIGGVSARQMEDEIAGEQAPQTPREILEISACVAAWRDFDGVKGAWVRKGFVGSPIGAF